MKKPIVYLFQSYEDNEQVFTVRAASEAQAIRKFKTYLEDLDMGFDDPTAVTDQFKILYPEVIQ